MSISSFTSMVRGGPGPPQTTDRVTAIGRVARAPASNSDSLVVVTPGLSLAFPYEVIPGRWATGATLPAVGADCLVVFDDAGDAWVPQWAGLATQAPAARAHRVVSFTPVAGWQKLPIETVDYDNARMFDAANGRFICPTAGVYHVAGNVTFNVSGTGTYTQLGVGIYRNGLAVAQNLTTVAVQTEASAVLSDHVLCAAGDYLELWCQNSQLTAVALGTYQNFLSVSRSGGS